jgi:hypothetical protein
MPRLFDQVRAPSTWGVFLRAFTFGHVRQLDAVAARLLARLCAAAPLLPGRDRLAYLDIDDTIRGTYGYAKQGAGRGYSGVNGLNALLATLSTPAAAPVILGARLRRGATASVRGAGKLVSDALATARRAGVTGQLVVRGDSAFYAHDIVAACQRALLAGGARVPLGGHRDQPHPRAGLDPDPLPPCHLRPR